MTSVGTTCALCHSTVDNSFAPGIGKRLDGWPNRDLNPGAIIALSPAIDAAKKAVYNSWGKGKYDPRFNVDGINGPVVIPPAYGLNGINSTTFTGDGSDVAYWNRYVAVVQMGGQGSFSDPRLPLSVTNGTVDLVSSKLPALQAYQLSLKAPAPPPGSFDVTAAARGKEIFEGVANCVRCHSGESFTDANYGLHVISESVADQNTPPYASRSATKQYRTTPLKGVWQHAPYFHNGSAPTLEAVVQTYNTKQFLGLDARASQRSGAVPEVPVSLDAKALAATASLLCIRVVEAQTPRQPLVHDIERGALNVRQACGVNHDAYASAVEDRYRRRIQHRSDRRDTESQSSLTQGLPDAPQPRPDALRAAPPNALQLSH